MTTEHDTQIVQLASGEVDFVTREELEANLPVYERMVSGRWKSSDIGAPQPPKHKPRHPATTIGE